MADNRQNKAKNKPSAAANKAGKTNKTNGSVVECEVELDAGEWLSPDKGKTFCIDEDAKFPDIIFEIKTDVPGPYQWYWEIKWLVEACRLKEGKKRFKAKKAKLYKKTGKFQSSRKKWKADLGEVVGGTLTVKVEAGGKTFVRNALIRGKNPSVESVKQHLDKHKDKRFVELLKKIFKQETNYRQYYSDEMPLTAFDNGYGIGQLTNPEPTYEQTWSWKAQVKYIMEVRLPYCRSVAKRHLDKHGKYTDEMLDTETLTPYNGVAKGQFYYNWNTKTNAWETNSDVVCDPEQSNKGWLMTEKENKGKSLSQLQNDKKSKPFYTGRCYAEHIQDDN